MFLFKEVSSELRVREQSIVIHDVVNGKISILGNFKHGQPFGSFPMWENQYIKVKGWIDFFQYDYVQGHNVYPFSSATQIIVVVIMAAKPEFLIAKDANVSCIGNHSHDFQVWDASYNTYVKPAV